MKKYEFRQLFNKLLIDEWDWIFQVDDDNETRVGEGLDDELVVLNKLGNEGWSVAFQISFDETTGVRHLMMQREIES
jgi:hypothetical protein